MAVDSISVQGEAQLVGDVTVSEGSGITLTQVGQDIEISAPLAGATSISTIGALTASSTGTAVTSGAANTKGSYAELSASTPVAATSFDFNIVLVTAGDWLIDIATGGAGAETVIVSNILCSVAGAAEGNVEFVGHCPVPIAAGTRVSVRAQCTGAAASTGVVLRLNNGGQTGGSAAATYGANTADSGGTSVDPGAVANTKGAWSQLTAATSADIEYALLLIGNQANTNRLNAWYLVDIGTGGAGAETVIVSNVLLRVAALQDFLQPTLIPLPISVPSGTRLAARAQTDITDATDRLFDVAIVGFTP